MNNQFRNETLEEKPDLNKSYLMSSYIMSKGFTHLMKLVLSVYYNSNALNIIKSIIKDEPEEINKQNTEKWTALMLACRNCNTVSSIGTIKLLLKSPNIDVNKQDNDGWTALMMSCGYSNTYSNIEAVKLLLDHPDIDINKQDNKGRTALMIACKYSNIGSNMETVKLLLEYPYIDVNKQDKNGNTAFMVAFKLKSQELNKIIMDMGMNSKALGNKMNIYLKNKEGVSIIDMVPASNEFIEFIYNNRIEINNSILKRIIEKDIIGTELLIPHIFNPLNYGYEIMIEILKRHRDLKEIIYYCNLHTIVKKEALSKIQIQKEELYYKPDNIIALCSEINFKLKFKNPAEVFNELNDKLKYIFDIKNEEDMIKKVTFYL